MIKVSQTILHNPPEQNGNCFAAVIATITGIPINDVLPVHNMFERHDWHISLFCWLKKRGWLWRGAPEFDSFYKLGKAPQEMEIDMVRNKPYLVSGKTIRFDGEVNHVCIYINGELWHDPHPDNSGLTTQEFFEVIEPC